MAQNSESLYDNMPCPDCGCTELRQEIEQVETVYVDEHGDPSYFEPTGTVETKRLLCPDCDEVIWEQE